VPWWNKCSDLKKIPTTNWSVTKLDLWNVNKELMNEKHTTLYYKFVKITMGTSYTSFSQDSNEYNTVSVQDPFHHHTYTSTAPTSRHQTILI
jgi:hypothetical protein